MARKTTAAPAVSEFTEEQLASVLKLPQYTIAIDPGETVGFAMTYRPCDDREANLRNHYGVASLPELEFLDWLMYGELGMQAFRQCVLEEYRIYPEKAMMHSGKTVPTSECIGAIKMIARHHQVPLVEQQASIKEPMAGLLKGRGFKSIGANRHEKDAELHLWRYALYGAERKGNHAR